MMNWLPIGLVFSLIATNIVADNCRNFLCDLFECGSFAYQTRLGIYPTIWRDRGDVFLNSCNCVPGDTAAPITLGELPKFTNFYKLPWMVSTQLQYAWCGPISLYGELNYIQAGHKKTAINTAAALNSALAIRLSDYRAISLYVGILYNGDLCWCDTMGYFVGAKIGFIHHSTIDAHQIAVELPVTASCVCTDVFKRNFLKKSNKISGGVSAGVDYCLCDRLSLVLTGEVVISGGPKGAACIPLLPSEIIQFAGGSNLSTSRIKTEISFPITLGLKYTL